MANRRKMPDLDDFKSAILERVQATVDASEALRNLAEWIQKRTLLDDQPFSFREHEFQIAIANDTGPRVSVQKCSQVGLSELQVRLVLAYLGTHSNTRALYGLPTSVFAKEFSKDRFDTVIEGSPYLKSLVARETSNVSQKRVGTSVLYIQGLSGKVAGFSLPLGLLVVDELDLCDTERVDRMNSRLRHAPLDTTGRFRGLKRYFGTPSVLDYGIHKAMQQTDGKRYACKCEACGHWQVPEHTQLVCDGMDDGLDKVEQDDVSSLDLSTADILCDHCSKSLQPSLMQPSLRGWVQARPEALEGGYEVRPWDLPTYNTPESIIRQRSDYKMASEYWNQVLGLPYEDAENSFLADALTLYKSSKWQAPEVVLRGTPYYIGIDVGKTCHMMVLSPNPQGTKDVVWMGKIRGGRLLDSELHLGSTYSKDSQLEMLIYLCKAFKARCVVIDAGPDSTLAAGLTKAISTAYAAEYVRSIDDPLTFYTVKEERRVVKLARTDSLIHTMKDHNNGTVRYPARGSLRKELEAHTQALKLVVSEDAGGNPIRTFVKVNPNDHWIHALNYAETAMEIGASGMGQVVGVLPGVSVIKRN